MSSDHSSPVIRSRRHALKTVRPGLCGALCVPLAVASLWIDIACAQAPAEVAAATEPVCLCAVALRSGSFYSLQRPDYPPFPVNPFPELPVYRIGDSDFVVDDRSVDYSWEEHGEMLPSVLEQECAGTLSYGPGDLWLEITEASEFIVSLVLHGTVQGAAYQVLIATDLGTPRWKPEAIVIGQADQTPVNLTGTGEPVRFFRALKGETIVSISAVADASEPGPNGDPPGDLGQFMVFRSGPTNQALAVAYSISGTATNGVDYTELPGSITIPVGEESALISVEALYDDLAEFDETVTLTLELTGEYLIDPAYCEATVTIQCNAFVAVAELDGPVGIDYHGPLNSLIVSHNAATSGNPRNFARIDSSGQVTPWSSVSNLLEEVKVATAKQSAGGWQQGQLYFGLGAAPGAEGRIGRVSADGTGVTSSWASLTPPTEEFFRGGLAFDQTGIFGGDLIAVTGRPYEQGGLRQVWRLNSAGAPTLIAAIETGHLEGVAVLPNDPVWGGWAGKVFLNKLRDCHSRLKCDLEMALNMLIVNHGNARGVSNRVVRSVPVRDSPPHSCLDACQ